MGTLGGVEPACGAEDDRIPTKMAIIPPETCASSSWVNSRSLDSRTCLLVANLFAVVIIVVIVAAPLLEIAGGNVASSGSTAPQ